MIFNFNYYITEIIIAAHQQLQFCLNYNLQLNYREYLFHLHYPCVHQDDALIHLTKSSTHLLFYLHFQLRYIHHQNSNNISTSSFQNYVLNLLSIFKFAIHSHKMV